MDPTVFWTTTVRAHLSLLALGGRRRLAGRDTRATVLARVIPAFGPSAARDLVRDAGITHVRVADPAVLSTGHDRYGDLATAVFANTIDPVFNRPKPILAVRLLLARGTTQGARQKTPRARWPAGRWRAPRTIRPKTGAVDRPTGDPWSAVTYFNIRGCPRDRDVPLSVTYGRN